MPLPLADRIALVTGASRGIGHAAALALAKAGAHGRVVAAPQRARYHDAIRAQAAPPWLLDLKDYEGTTASASRC